MAHDVPHNSRRIVNCLSGVKHFIIERCCCCCFCTKDETVNYDDQGNFFIDRADEGKDTLISSYF